MVVLMLLCCFHFFWIAFIEFSSFLVAFAEIFSIVFLRRIKSLFVFKFFFFFSILFHNVSSYGGKERGATFDSTVLSFNVSDKPKPIPISKHLLSRVNRRARRNVKQFSASSTDLTRMFVLAAIINTGRTVNLHLLADWTDRACFLVH